MDENHQDAAGSKLIATEVKLWLPPLSPQDQKKLDRFWKKRFPKWTGFSNKTLWDWLQLLGILAIPLVVAFASIGFSIQQADLAQQQHDNDQKIANQQHEADKQSALDQQETTTLQTYIANIQDLLLNHNLLGDSPKPKSDTDKVTIQEVRELARARTLTALQGLDSHRKGILLNFLYEAHLIGYYDSNAKKPLNAIINLYVADLSGVYLSVTDLNPTELSDANLSGAYMIVPDRNPTELSGANLSGANLSGAHLYDTDLSGADLSYADLSHADLYDAFLGGANLHHADLNYAHLEAANLSYADLSYADLRGADLSGAIVTQEQLAKAKSLQGATMPDGSKHP